MGIFDQDLNQTTRESITVSLCELAKKHIRVFEDAGCGMYNLALYSERLNYLVDPNEQVSFFQIYPDRNSLHYMWLLTYHSTLDESAEARDPQDYNLTEFSESDLLTIYQAVKEAIRRNECIAKDLL